MDTPARKPGAQWRRSVGTMSLRLFVMHQSYRSHARVAAAYVDVFTSLPDSLVQIVDTPEAANICYLHMEPDKIEQALQQVPSLLPTYKIGYCVWESDHLPDSHIQSIAMLDEVWTASFYNYRCFSQVHPRVRWIPHITGDAPKPSPDDLGNLRHLLAIEEEDFCYLFVGKDVPRKNITGLAESFHYVNQRLPNTRLIVKTNGDEPQVTHHTDQRISYCHGNLPDAAVAALYALCDCYVSAHHSEGWGLPLSDAMQHGKLCIGTGHSGNLDFMTAQNSLPIHCSIAHVEQAHLHHFFRRTMRWAYPHPESLEAQMLSAYALIQSGEATRLTAQASQDIRRFDRRHVRCLMRACLQSIAQHIAKLKEDATEGHQDFDGDEHDDSHL